MQEEKVKEVIDNANDVATEIRRTLFGDLKNDAFVEIDQKYPEIITTGEAPPSISDSAKAHAEYQDRISKMMLTTSLFLGLGIEPPTGHALSDEVVKKFISESVEGAITSNYNEETKFFDFVVELGDARYSFSDSDEWLGGLRALHFLTMRHDPDLGEIIDRKLAHANGLDENWVKQVRESAKK